MAARYARAIGGNWSTDATWSTTSGGTADTVAPTAADDVYLDANSGNVTINSGATRLCRSINCTGFTGTLTHASNVNLDIGDATAGAGNVALLFVSGMTYTVTSNFSSQLRFTSSSATQQTLDFAGKSIGRFYFGGASNGNWILNSNLTATSDSNNPNNLERGTFDTNGYTVSMACFGSAGGGVRSLLLGSSSFTLTAASTTVWAVSGTNFSISAGTSTITCNGASAVFSNGYNSTFNVLTMSGSSPTVSASTSTFTTLNLTGSGSATIASAITATTLTRTGTAAKTDSLVLSANITVTTALNLTGNSSINRLLVQANALANQRMITNTGAAVTLTNVDLQDTVLSETFDASAQTNVGDCGGNSGITFPASVTQTATGTASFTWSTHGWTTRVPLPQDDVVINNAFVAGRTITSDMPRLGRSISFTGATGSPTWAFSSTTNSIFGSVTLIAAMTISGTNVTTLAGRSSYTLTSAGVQYTQGITVAAPAGTYTLSDAFSTAGVLTFTHGTFNASTFNVTALTYSGTGATTRGITMGTGTWSITSTATTTVWSFGTTTGLTFSGASSTITIAAASANVRTFAGGGLTYGALTYTVAGSTGGMDITGANTFSFINFSDITNARSLRFTAATTTTISSAAGWNVNGTATKLMTVSSITAATHTIRVTSGTVSADYMNLVNSIATGGATFYAGANSTDGGGNTGWIFTDPPPIVTSSAGGKSRTQSMLNLQNVQRI